MTRDWTSNLHHRYIYTEIFAFDHTSFHTPFFARLQYLEIERERGYLYRRWRHHTTFYACFTNNFTWSSMANEIKIFWKKEFQIFIAKFTHSYSYICKMCTKRDSHLSKMSKSEVEGKRNTNKLLN